MVDVLVDNANEVGLDEDEVEVTAVVDVYDDDEGSTEEDDGVEVDVDVGFVEA